MLVNTNPPPTDPLLSDAAAFFQPEIRVTATSVEEGAFVERPVTVDVGSDEDLRSYRLLYRHAREFAAGHGCSVWWDKPAEMSDRAHAITTTFTPEFAVRLSDSNPEIDLKCLEMLFLRDAQRTDVVSELEKICTGYEGWIANLSDEKVKLRPELRPIADDHIIRCSEALRQIKYGINLLGTDAVVWEAFRLMNRAMLQQRARTEWLRDGKKVPAPLENETLKWRPFQLAFILLCLTGIADPHSEDRKLADLLWFPTGGGKTEAYLGTHCIYCLSTSTAYG